MTAMPKHVSMEFGVPDKEERSYPVLARMLSTFTKFSAKDMNGVVSKPLKRIFVNNLLFFCEL